jgi:hypothetical protein
VADKLNEMGLLALTTISRYGPKAQAQIDLHRPCRNNCHVPFLGIGLQLGHQVYEDSRRSTLEKHDEP